MLGLLFDSLGLLACSIVLDFGSVGALTRVCQRLKAPVPYACRREMTQYWQAHSYITCLC